MGDQLFDSGEIEPEGSGIPVVGPDAPLAARMRPASLDDVVGLDRRGAVGEVERCSVGEGDLHRGAAYRGAAERRPGPGRSGPYERVFVIRRIVLLAFPPRSWSRTPSRTPPHAAADAPPASRAHRPGHDLLRPKNLTAAAFAACALLVPAAAAAPSSAGCFC